MKRIVLILIVSLSFHLAYSQGTVVPEGYVLVDSVVLRRASVMDSTLVGKSIFSIMPSKDGGASADVKVHQSKSISDAMQAHISKNSTRNLSGYRVRIYFDSQQHSRGTSESIVSRFSSKYPGIPAYRTYQNPYFKVTVGDFRTKSEAMLLLKAIKDEFPAAFVVKENINFPVIDKSRSYVADTVKVLRKIGANQL